MADATHRWGCYPLTIPPASDPGEDVLCTEAWITRQVFNSGANPSNMNTARLTADGFRRTLDYINRLPEARRAA